MVLQAENVTYESINIGDELPAVTKVETQETINNYARKAVAPRPGWHDLHTEEEFASQGIFGGTVNQGVATAGYLMQVVEKAFPLTSIVTEGARLQAKAIEPIRAGDTITISGRVVEKRIESSRKLVDCELTALNQFGHTVYVGKVTVVL